MIGLMRGGGDAWEQCRVVNESGVWWGGNEKGAIRGATSCVGVIG